MIAVIGKFRLPIERCIEAKPIMQRVISATLQEEGCLAYSYSEDVSEPGLFRVSEMWESQEHLTAHLATPHMQRWREERSLLGLTGRSIKSYTLSNERAF